MNIHTAICIASKKIGRNSPTPILDSELLLAYALKRPKEFVYSHPEHELTSCQLKKFNKLVIRRKKLEPIAYITSQKEFFGLNFYVNRTVLIPRPDTENLVEKIIDYYKASKKKFHHPLILDIGTGSGCIAISLKKYLPFCDVIASDISAQALKIAKKNAKKNNVKVKFFQSNLFKNIPEKYTGKIDIIAANLPYLPKNIAQKKSLQYEPNIALQNHKQLLNFLPQVEKFIKPNGKIFLEINKNQIKMMKKSGLNCEFIAF